MPIWCQVICNHHADSLRLVSDRFAMWTFQRKSHDSDVIMSAAAFQITGISIVYSTVCSGADQRKHQSSASLAFVRGIHRWPVDSPHKAPSNAENVSIWWRHHELSVFYRSSTWNLKPATSTVLLNIIVSAESSFWQLSKGTWWQIKICNFIRLFIKLSGAYYMATSPHP